MLRRFVSGRSASSAIAIAIAGVPLLFLSGCGDAAAPPPEDIRPVRTVIVEPKPIDDDRQSVGEIRPRQESDIGFQVGGKLISRAVDVGNSVKTGDLLARLDETDFQNRLRSANSDVVSAEAVLIEAQATEDRQNELVGKGVTTRANYDAAVKNRRSAEAQLESAKAALDLAKDQLAYTELKADFDGIITAVAAEPGQVVSAGQTVVKLAKPDQIDAVFNVAEAAFRDRKSGEKPEIVVTLLSSPSIVADGVVREVSPVADPTTRTYQVKVSLENPPAAMRFGASVMGRLKATTAPVIVLPGSALYDRGGKPAVWIYDPASSTVKLKPVDVARFETDKVVVSDGLAKGDVVVTAGVNRLREGQQVRLAEGAGS
jgi:RND family efflux transporter MFP subunit